MLLTQPKRQHTEACAGEGLPKPQKGTSITPHMDRHSTSTSHTHSDTLHILHVYPWLDRVLKLAGCSADITAHEHDTLSGGNLRVDIALPLRKNTSPSMIHMTARLSCNAIHREVWLKCIHQASTRPVIQANSTETYTALCHLYTHS